VLFALQYCDTRWYDKQAMRATRIILSQGAPRHVLIVVLLSPVFLEFALHHRPREKIEIKRKKIGSDFVGYGNFSCIVSKPEEEKVCWIASKTDVSPDLKEQDRKGKGKKMEI